MMILLSFFSYGIIAVYCFIILSYLYGWEKIIVYKRGPQAPSLLYISIIIALRNEEKNVKRLLDSLLNQTLSSNSFEIILIDDKSTDNTFEIMNQLASSFQNIRMFKLEKNSGKKQAVLFGISQSKGQLIITTDADCIHHPRWIQTIHDHYLKSKPKMIIGPVIMQSKSFFEKIQSLDFYSLMVSGAGASGIQKPIMCNGANLAFEKKIFEEFMDPFNSKIISGDDIFMLLHFKEKYANEICFLKSNEAMVYTIAESNFNSFLQQRRRWASKSTSYRDKDILLTAFVVLFTNTLILINLVLSFVNNKLLFNFIAMFLLKSLIDFSFLARTNQYFKHSKLFFYFIPTQLFNFVFVPFIAFSGIISSVKWKGRNYF